MTDDGGIRASDADREQFTGYEGSLIGELQDYLVEHARRESYALLTSDAPGRPVDLPQQARLEVPRPEPEIKPAQDKLLPVAAGPPRRRVSPMLPILVIWLGIALTAREPFAFVPVLVILFMLLRLATRPTRSNRWGPHGRPGDHDSGHGDGSSHHPD